ncbi:MAG TPA: RNA methyltransferase, partial [Candidatus Binatia bacterium]|nr:RNA methyltransferase [Candidatus Binatia bacterium]
MADLQIQKITSPERPDLEPYRTLKRSAAHEALGIFVVEGDKVLHRLLESHFTIVSALLIEERVAEFEPLLRARPETEIKLFVCEKPVLTQMAGFEIYQGVLAIAKIPGPLPLETVLANSSRPRLFVAMDELSNAENVGTLMRNCLAFGVQALIAGETCSSPFLRRTVRNSMGAAFKLPVLESAN